MAHSISGIITSFKYTGALPHIVLVGNYYFIPLGKRREPNYKEEVISPYSEFTQEAKKQLKELSFEGKCCYIETDYFGGIGAQMGETWQNGKRIAGPLVSLDGTNRNYPETEVIITGNAINENLQLLGIYQHPGMDEFDSVRLGWYRSNSEVLKEYYAKRNNLKKH
ncbi:hypothetical protein D3C87_370910 [compost metagenome]